MSPKQAADTVTGYVDGVHYNHNLRANLVVVGTGVVARNSPGRAHGSHERSDDSQRVLELVSFAVLSERSPSCDSLL